MRLSVYALIDHSVYGQVGENACHGAQAMWRLAFVAGGWDPETGPEAGHPGLADRRPRAGGAVAGVAPHPIA